MRNKIPYINLKKQSKEENNQIIKALRKILSSSDFILGDETQKFEKNICKYLNIKYCLCHQSILFINVLSYRHKHYSCPISKYRAKYCLISAL